MYEVERKDKFLFSSRNTRLKEQILNQYLESWNRLPTGHWSISKKTTPGFQNYFNAETYKIVQNKIGGAIFHLIKIF